MSVARELERALDGTALGVQALPHGDELPLAAPASIEEWALLVRLAADRGWKLLPVGLGSKLGWCRPPAACDLVVSTHRFAGALAHEPDDGTIAVRAGTTVAALAEVCASGGHRVVPDVPAPERATIGGALAAAQSGWGRLRFGPARDQVLGMRVLLGDGTLAKSGGQLVKNVTGYDMHRLYCGSHGSFCAILEVALRLYPLSACELWIEREVDSAETAFARAAAVRARTGVRPVALAVGGDAERWRVAVHLAGLSGSVEWERTEVEQVLGSGAAYADDEARRRAAFWRDAECADERWPDLTVHEQPSRAGATMRSIEERAAEAGLGRTVLAHPAIATLSVWLDGTPAERDVWLARHTDELRRELAPRGGRVFLRNGSAALLRQIEPLGDPTGLPLMRALQEKLDPAPRFTRGRLHAEL